VNNALLRFWWVVTLGIFFGVSIAVWIVYEIPGFTPREDTVYTAATQLFVTSAEGQYVRVSVPRTVDSGSTRGARGSAGQGGGSRLVINEPPNVEPLLAAANVYPLLIASDDVARLREKLFGPLPGTVTATAFTAVSTATRFLPAQLPVIDIFATSSRPREATTLAQATAETFKRWIKREQDRAGVAPRERIRVELLRAPRGALPSGGPSYGIPILAALAVASAFVILAFVLDQLLPRGAEAPQVLPSPSDASSETRRRWA